MCLRIEGIKNLVKRQLSDLKRSLFKRNLGFLFCILFFQFLFVFVVYYILFSDFCILFFQFQNHKIFITS